MSREGWVERAAPAKVNLFLEVLARRPDGYHELETVMLALDLADRVRARRSSRSGVSCTLSGPQASPDVPSDERNLAVRGALAALALARSKGAAAPGEGVLLELEKHVPSQAGLGGASSDAAAAFAAVESVFQLHCSEEEACAALAALGSDCVFFRRAATSGLALCSGRGERVEPLAPAPADLAALVVTPDSGAPTALVYARLESPLSWAASRRSVPECFNFATSRPGAWPADLPCFNRLEEAACAAVPALERWRAVLAALDGGSGGGRFCLSGSGSSFFSLRPSRAQAEQLKQRALAALARAGLEPRGVWVCAPMLRA